MRDIWLIRLSVRPSPRYSTSGSLLVFSKGRMASERTAPASSERKRPSLQLGRKRSAAAATRIKAKRAIHAKNRWSRAGRATEGLEVAAIGGAAAEAPEISWRANAKSRAVWKRSLGSFSRQRETIRSRPIGN